MQELQSLRDERRDIRRDVSLIKKGRLVLMVISMLLPQGAMDPSIAIEQPSSTNLYILMKNFIHLLKVVQEAVLEVEACLDSLKKSLDHKLGIESHYMMIMNMFHLLPTVEETKVTKPWTE
ncbi:hypothetical protein M9H77_31132 [Catharanthus roseus]|uniref:Uncharacterized protein n=1 Tax=Catharanthus roseus TaxID=4058 RepID=A0ACC0A124_CATRO|nr:hypothetical protein M9H77_31132 [Catharanthus roseus]